MLMQQFSKMHSPVAAILIHGGVTEGMEEYIP